MHRSTVLTVIVLVGSLGRATRSAAAAAAAQALRPPAVSLVACDPYFSIWSPGDHLAGQPTTHWTGRPHRLTSLIRVDGRVFRLMGDEPQADAPLPQTGLEVRPTQTRYRFQGQGVAVDLTFLQPALPESIDLLSRPLVYLTWTCRSVDGEEHDVAVYLDAGAEIAVHEPNQTVVWSRPEAPGLHVLRVGSADQPILARQGDNVRIDWGYLYLAASRSERTSAALAAAAACRAAFAAGNRLPPDQPCDRPTAVREQAPVSALCFDLGRLERRSRSCRAVVAYDDRFSVRYFGRPLRPYWRRHGTTLIDLLPQALRDYPALQARCDRFDRELLADLTDTGGADYARMAALAYRQCLGANKIVADAADRPLMFSKECFSNGCMGTVDVFYPMSPQFLLLAPGLMKATVVPLLDYAASDRWPFPFAPHDLGRYPIVSGQVYGGGARSEENQMPVEECGNMLLLVAAIAQAEDRTDLARRYWPLLSRWAAYLAERGLDPPNQLCTDDFAGHLAHNANLSIKAILALAAYGQLAARLGEANVADTYLESARRYAARWSVMADDGDHTRLAFDRPGTWSQKYNLIWDRVLGLHVFEPGVAKREMAYYRRVQKPYGLPLDNRTDYTKLDWIFWTACLTGRPDDFHALTQPVARFCNETPDRVPLTDWYWTHNARRRGFQARPVVGALFMPLLTEPAIWRKWAARGERVTGPWAPLPRPPRLRVLVPTARREPTRWRYRLERPAGDWTQPDYDVRDWAQGPAGFGTRGTPGAVVGTIWQSRDLWLRRTFTLSAPLPERIVWVIHHDEDTDIALNGVRAATLAGYTTDYETVPLSDAARAALRIGRNTLAVHCRQTTGGQFIDVGLAAEEPAP